MIINHKSPYSEEIYQLIPSFSKYKNGQLAIKLFDSADGFPYGIATISIDKDLSEDEVAIKNYSENEGLLLSLIKSGLIEKPHRYVKSGYVDIPICKILTNF